MTFQVNRKEVYIQPVLIEADSEEEAITKVEVGKGVVLNDELEYSYTLESDEWSVYKR